MLVLTRKPQEKIRIGDDITITVIKTKGKAVRLGIEAPSNVNVLRGELLFEDDSTNSDEQTEPTGSTQHNRVQQVFEQQADARSETTETKNVESNTQFIRASRSRIKTLLPDLLGEAGPLRDMLDRRTEVS